jgi:hypothetical protein
MEIRFCSLCGTERWPGAVFCGGCGAVIDTASAANAVPAEVPADPQPVGGLADPLEPWPAPVPVDPRVDPLDPEPQVAASPAAPWHVWTDGATTPVTNDVAVGALADPPDVWTNVATAPFDHPMPVPIAARAAAPIARQPGWQRGERVATVRTSPIAVGFVALGMVLVATGCLLVAAGIPAPGVAYAPLTSGDLLGTRLPEAAAVGAALVSAAAALLVAVLGVRGAIGPGVATGLLLVFGAAGIGLGILAASSAGWTAAGDVLPGPILMITGGAAALAAAVGGWIARE